MILYRYIARELLSSFLGVTFVLFLIYLGGLMMRVLPDVSNGSIPIEQFLPIISVKILEELIIGIPFSFFLALIVSIGKLLSEHELIAAYACGFQRSKLMMVVTALALFLSLLVGIVSISLAPLADQHYRKIMAEIEQSSELNSIVAGRFVGLSGGGLIYAESGNNKTGFNKVSIFDSTSNKYSVINAERLSGIKSTDSGKIFLFENGTKTTLLRESREVKKTVFDEYGVLVEKKNVMPAHSMYGVPTSVLWSSQDPLHIAELQWRLSLPLMVLILGMVAVSVSRYKPRSGKYGRLFSGIVIYLIYSQLIMNAKVGIVQQTIPPIIGMWWVHLSVVLIFITLFIYQERRAG